MSDLRRRRQSPAPHSAIVCDETLSDQACFGKIEAIVSLLEDLGLSCGGRHDFG